MMLNKRDDDDSDLEGPFIFGEEQEQDESEDESPEGLEWESEAEDERLVAKQNALASSEPAPKARKEQVAIKTGQPRARRVNTTQSKLEIADALRIVELKFRFWIYVITYLCGGAILAGINQFFRYRSGYVYPLWFQWPLIVYAIFLIVPFFRAYVFKGRDLRSLLDATLRRMAEREVEKSEVYYED